MNQKYFPFDKNYILEKAQLDHEQRLIVYMVNYTKAHYMAYSNPLGLEDDTIISIKKHHSTYTQRLSEFYRDLAAIYRFKYGQNQLELLFDGQDHYQKYASEWKTKFKEWLFLFCERPNFVKAVLELTVFYPEGKKSLLAENRMKTFIYQHFDLKVYKYKGIREKKVA